MRALKFHGRLSYGRVLGELFVNAIRAARHDAWPDLILPVPLADARFRERGFNQAIEIGKVLERRMRIPLRADIVVRTRNTLEQTGLDHRSRRRNLRKAFAISQPLAVKHIAILDDVITTGSTMNELARTLRRSGATRIEAWAVARTPKQ
jgi:ComF family protein